MRLPRQAVLTGIGLGAIYGLTARFAAKGGEMGDPVIAMTFAFLFLVPGAIGYLTVRPHPAPSWWFRLLAPWIPILVSVLVAALVGWEGSICIIMGLPVLLVGGSIGGAVGGAKAARHPVGSGVAMLLPLFLAPAESRLPRPVDRHIVENFHRHSGNGRRGVERNCLGPDYSTRGTASRPFHPAGLSPPGECDAEPGRRRRNSPGAV